MYAYSIDAVSDRDFILEFLSTNAITAIHLSRLGEEWVLWSSEEFGFLVSNDKVTTGSMIPQRNNPDPMELVRGKTARVVGDLVTLLVLCKGLPHAYNRDLQVKNWNHYLPPLLVFTVYLMRSYCYGISLANFLTVFLTNAAFNFQFTINLYI